MNPVADLEDFTILLLVSLVPALLYLSWVRKTERYRAEAWGPLLSSFATGALFATITAAVLEALLVGLGTAVSQRFPAPEFVFLNGGSSAGAFFLVLCIAPVVEEALKGSVVYGRRAGFRVLGDGPVFGASAGLGFGFFETLLYGLGAFFVGGLAAGIFLIAIRSVSSVLLHGSSTGMFGYGVARSRFALPGAGTGSYYAVAIGMHATFNALASLPAILALLGVGGVAADIATAIALVAAIGFAFGAIEHVRSVIAASEYPALVGLRYKSPARAPVKKR